MEKLKKALAWLQGKKLYLLLLAGALERLYAYLSGDLSGGALAESLWLLAMGGAGRSAVSKLEK